MQQKVGKQTLVNENNTNPSIRNYKIIQIQYKNNNVDLKPTSEN